MKTLQQQMAVYAAYHRHPLNKLTHFVGVPLIVFAILIPMGWPGIAVGGIRLSLAQLFVAVVLAYYFALDRRLAWAMLAVMVPIVYAAQQVSTLATATGAWVFAACFGLGWALQLLGHWFEGRRPALADNLFQVFVAPIFLAAEVAFACGWRTDLREALRRPAQGEAAQREG